MVDHPARAGRWWPARTVPRGRGLAGAASA